MYLGFRVILCGYTHAHWSLNYHHVKNELGDGNFKFEFVDIMIQVLYVPSSFLLYIKTCHIKFKDFGYDDVQIRYVSSIYIQILNCMFFPCMAASIC